MSPNARKRLIKRLKERAEITIECEPDSLQIEGNCSAIGPEEDAETLAWIVNELNRGNEWAWCAVKVTATFEGMSASDYLGGCSYESEHAFKDPHGYYPDMVNRAIEGLADAIVDDLARNATLRRAISY